MNSYPIDEIQDLYDEAVENYDDISDNAQSFLDDLEGKLDFATEEEVGNIRLSDAQYSWLKNIAAGEANRSNRW